MLNVVNKYHDVLNFSYANITDYARDLHWKIDKTAPSGYIFAPDYGSANKKNMESYDRRTTYEILPIYKEKNRPDILQRTPGTSVDIKSAFYNNYGKKYVGNVKMDEQALPDNYRDQLDYTGQKRGGKKLSSSIKKKVGSSLLVPYQDVYASNYNSSNHKAALNLAIKTTGLRTSVIQYIYPNFVEYMADNIQYRCQDTFMLLVTDGNTITNSENRKAAQRYIYTGKSGKEQEKDTKKGIGLRPKSSNSKDADGYYYNGSDFPQQSIRSYAIGIGTNPSKFKRFEQYGDGKAATATYPEDVEEIFEEFIKDMMPSNIFSMTSPSGSFLYTSDATSFLIANIHTDMKGWVGQLKFTKDFSNAPTTDDPDDEESHAEFAKYIPNYATYIASTKRGLLDLTKSSNKLTHKDLNLQGNLSIDSYLKWLTNYTESKKVTIDTIDTNGTPTTEIITVYTGDTLPIFSSFRKRSVDALSEKRYLGDVLSSSLEMIGAVDPVIKAPQYLGLGSNDGTFKLYKSNPDYNKFLGINTIPIYDENDDSDDPKIIGYYKEKIYDTSPYIYSFAYIPGTSEKNNGLNVLQSLVLRSSPNYSTAIEPAHQYNVNGETAFRTTDKGHTFLVATLGQGGKGAFALNVTGTDQISGRPVGLEEEKSAWPTSVPLWDTSTDQFGYAAEGSGSLGYILGKPVISRIALDRKHKIPNLKQNVKYIIALDRKHKIPNLKQNVKYIAALPSGAYGDQTLESGPTIYIYDALGVDVGTQAYNNTNRQPGALIKKVTYPLTANQKQKFKYHNSLSELTLVDLDFDGVSDIGYAGDLNGNLYRLDLRGDTVNDWKLDLIFEGDPARPILNAPSISRFFKKSIVIFGTGSLSRAEPTKKRSQQILYGLMENSTFTAHAIEPIQHNDPRLVSQTITKHGDAAYVSNNVPVWQGFVGWKLPLGFETDAGEALVQKPIIFNGTIFFQTYIYKNYQDQPNKELKCYRTLDASDTWLYQINGLTGGALDSNSAYLRVLGQKGGSAGIRTKGKIDQPVKLLEANKSRPISADGESLSGNDKDQTLLAENSKADSYEIPIDAYNKECKPGEALLSDGKEIVCGEPLKPEPLKPSRISIQNIF